MRTGYIPSEADSAAIATVITQDASRAHLERLEAVGQLMLVEVARNVGHIEVRVCVVGELLELGIERLLDDVSLAWDGSMELTLAKLTS
jgi:hypothetical protein